MTKEQADKLAKEKRCPGKVELYQYHLTPSLSDEYNVEMCRDAIDVRSFIAQTMDLFSIYCSPGNQLHITVKFQPVWAAPDPENEFCLTTLGDAEDWDDYL